MNQFHTYILYSITPGKYYVGATANLKDRIKRHNEERSKTTKTGIPWEVKYHECFPTRPEAYPRKPEIKK